MARCFSSGQVVGASLGARRGLPALDAIVQALAGGAFNFEVLSRLHGQPDIALSSDALHMHLDTLLQRGDGDGGQLPSLDAVPEVIVQDEPAAAAQPLPLDRVMLLTLLAVDGVRTVREVVAHRGTIDALWQLGSLAAAGLIRVPAPNRSLAAAPGAPLGSLAAAPGPAPPIGQRTVGRNRRRGRAIGPRPDRARARATRPRPDRARARAIRPSPGSARARASEPRQSLSEARLRRRSAEFVRSAYAPTSSCFAAETPMPLFDQQRELCLSDQFGTCPRGLSMAVAPDCRALEA